MPIPPAEVAVDADLVSRLLAQQHPQLAGLPVSFLNNGWDNFMFRLGEDLLVRLPRRQMGAELMQKELRYVPEIAPRLPLPVSVPLYAGEPGCGYPWHWSITPWIPGTSADKTPPTRQSLSLWTQFLQGLHTEAPIEGPRNSYRGVPLATRDEAFMERLQHLRDRKLAPYAEIYSLWQQGLDADPAFIPCWLHGDLHPLNIVCDQGKIVGVIDWGDLCIGDVATDLASYYQLFSHTLANDFLRHHYGASPAQIARARASAVFFAVVFLDSGVDESPQQVAIARKTFSNLGLP